MQQFDPAPVVTSNPFSVNDKQCFPRNREMLAPKRNVRLSAPCDRASRHHNREGPQLGRPMKRKLVMPIELVALVDTSVAIAQTAGSALLSSTSEEHCTRSSRHANIRNPNFPRLECEQICR